MQTHDRIIEMQFIFLIEVLLLLNYLPKRAVCTWETHYESFFSYTVFVFKGEGASNN